MVPRSNAAWWRAKLQRTRVRDRETDRTLRRNGWEVVVVWEHDDPVQAAERVAALVRDRLTPHKKITGRRGDR